MIPGFEKYTPDLTDKDKEIAEVIRASLSKRTKFNKITTSEIISSIFKWNGHRMDGAKLRKMVHYLRGTGTPILADHKGYHVSYDEKELTDQINSLQHRCNSIRHGIMALETTLRAGRLKPMPK